MLSSFLHSKRAVQVNIEIMRAFVRLRRMLGSHAELAHMLAALERKYDRQFTVVFDAIREIIGHEVKTVPEAGWASFKNGELLGRAQALSEPG